MSEAKGPYGHTPVSGNSTHTGEGCKACGYAEGFDLALEFIIKQAVEFGACAHSEGHCICDITHLAEDVEEALEADGEGKNE